MQNLGLSLDEIHEYFSGASDLTPMINRLEKMRNELTLTIEKLKDKSKFITQLIAIIELKKMQIKS